MGGERGGVSHRRFAPVRARRWRFSLSCLIEFKATVATRSSRTAQPVHNPLTRAPLSKWVRPFSFFIGDRRR